MLFNSTTLLLLYYKEEEREEHPLTREYFLRFSSNAVSQKRRRERSRIEKYLSIFLGGGGEERRDTHLNAIFRPLIYVFWQASGGFEQSVITISLFRRFVRFMSTVWLSDFIFTIFDHKKVKGRSYYGVKT